MAAWVLKFSADKLTKEVIGMARERKHPPRKRRRGRFRLFYQLLSLVAVAAAMVTACVIFFRVNQVEVQGNSHYDAQTIIDASGIQVGDNLVTMWEPDINDRICQKLPYVERVVLHRVLPDRVNLLVVERTAAATVEGGGSQWLLSADGYLLETTQEPQGVQITGIQAVNPQAGAPLEVEENSQSKAQVIPKLMSALEQAGKLSQCTQIDCSAAASLKVSYDIHQLKFPLHGDYERMLNLFQAALDSGVLPDTEEARCLLYGPSGDSEQSRHSADFWLTHRAVPGTGGLSLYEKNPAYNPYSPSPEGVDQWQYVGFVPLTDFPAEDTSGGTD